MGKYSPSNLNHPMKKTAKAPLLFPKKERILNINTGISKPNVNTTITTTGVPDRR